MTAPLLPFVLLWMTVAVVAGLQGVHLHTVLLYLGGVAHSRRYWWIDERRCGRSMSGTRPSAAHTDPPQMNLVVL